MPLPLHWLNTETFEPWDYRNPDTHGIGGSETAVIEMAWRMARRGYPVTVYGPVPDDCHSLWRGTRWRHYSELHSPPDEPGIWILSRCPHMADCFEYSPLRRLWLVCQDMDYDHLKLGFTPARAAKFERIVALCARQAINLKRNHPYLANKVVLSTNGIRMDLIREVEAKRIARDPHRLVYFSSPDRGLLPLLKIFRRAREWVPDLSLEIAYGFDNIDKHPSAPTASFKKQCLEAADQPGVTWLGRLPQREVLRHLFGAGLWCYPFNARVESSPVHGDTLVETLAGAVKVRELVGRKDFGVYSCGPDGRLSTSTVKSVSCTRRNAETVRLDFRTGNGKSGSKPGHLILTPDHEVMLTDGRYVPAGTLKPGDRVKAFTRFANRWGKGYASGGLTGQELVPLHRFVAERKLGRALAHREVVDHLDGNTRNNEPNNLCVRASQSEHAKDHWERLSPEERAARCARHGEGTRKWQASLPSEELSEIRGRGGKRLWERLDAMPPYERAQFIRERAAKITPEGKRRNAEAVRVRKEVEFGNAPWRDRDKMHDLYIRQGLSTVLIGHMLGCSNFCVGVWLKKHGIPVRPVGTNRRVCENHVIVAVTPDERTDVFCMEVDPDHNFVANGIVVHNCIACMEAQACGCVPIVSALDAVEENVLHGTQIEGDVTDSLVLARFVQSVIEWCDSAKQAEVRPALMYDSRLRFNWERVCDQWAWWIKGKSGFAPVAQYSFQHAHARGRILNVGCGSDSSDLAALGALNVDIADKHPDGSAHRAHVLADARDLPASFHGRFDTVILGDILEHFTTFDRTRALAEAQKCLAPEGRIVVTWPVDSRPAEEQRVSGEYAPGLPVPHPGAVTFGDMSLSWQETGLVVDKASPLDYTFAEGWGVVLQ